MPRDGEAATVVEGRIHLGFSVETTAGVELEGGGGVIERAEKREDLSWDLWDVGLYWVVIGLQFELCKGMMYRVSIGLWVDYQCFRN